MLEWLEWLAMVQKVVGRLGVQAGLRLSVNTAVNQGKKAKGERWASPFI